MPHAALAETLQVLQQRSLPPLEFSLAHPLDRPHQVTERAHEREGSRVQSLDLCQQALEQRPEAGPVGLVLVQFVGEVGQGVANCRQAGGVEPADLSAKCVEPGQQLLGQLASRRDVVRVTVSSPFGGGRCQAGVVVAFDRAPAVEPR